MEKENAVGLKNITIGLMIVAALLFDAVQAIINLLPIAGQILSGFVSFFAFMTFWLWFRLNGLKFTSAKRVSYMGGGFILELIPILNMLPAWTLAVFLLCADFKIKQKTQGAAHTHDSQQENTAPLPPHNQNSLPQNIGKNKLAA